jgi:hypothetical protein
MVNTSPKPQTGGRIVNKLAVPPLQTNKGALTTKWIREVTLCFSFVVISQKHNYLKERSLSLSLHVFVFFVGNKAASSADREVLSLKQMCNSVREMDGAHFQNKLLK